MDEFFAVLKQLDQERAEAVKAALPAMDRLADVLCGRSGQSYRLRSILWSMYNGKKCRLELVNLDWEIRKDFSIVSLAFGAPGFFYDEMKAAIRRMHQWDWFTEEGGAK